jgi:hypothetical protein
MSMSEQQLQSWQPNPNAITIEVPIPDENTAQQLVSEYTKDRATQQVTFVRDQMTGTSRVRISLRPEAVSQFKDRLTKLADTVERSYQSAGLTSSQR